MGKRLRLYILRVLALLGTIVFVARTRNQGGNSSSDGGRYQHGRVALRMGVLRRAVGGQQRVSSSSQLQHQRLVGPHAWHCGVAGACSGVEVSESSWKTL